MPQRAMRPERQVPHQTATQPVREAWLQTERQELAKPQQMVSPLEQPEMPPRRVNQPEQQHQTETRELVWLMQKAIRPEQVSRQRKERRHRRVKRGPAQASEPQRPRTVTEQAQQQVSTRQTENRTLPQRQMAMPVRKPQTVKQRPAVAEVLPRQRENLPSRPEPRCRRARQVLRAVSPP